MAPRFFSIVNAMGDYQAMMDAIRDGLVNKTQADCPEDVQERSSHLKSFGYFNDASMVGIAALPPSALLNTPYRNPDIDRLAQDLKTRQTKTLASGIDVIMADLRDSMSAPPSTIVGHQYAIVFLYDMPRDPRPEELGADWLENAQAHRACLRASETAVVLANYIRVLGWDAKAHTATSADVDLNQLTVAAGLACVEDGVLVNPYLGSRFGVAVVTTTMPLACDAPLAPMKHQTWLRTNAPAWWIGAGSTKSAFTKDPFARRDFVLGPHPFETLKRVEDPTTYIDATRVARVPKRADMFARAQFGDMGKTNQDATAGGHYARKAAPQWRSGACWVHLFCCRMARQKRGFARQTPPAMPRISRPPAIFWAWMLSGSVRAPIGRGTAMMQSALPSSRPMTRRSV